LPSRWSSPSTSSSACRDVDHPGLIFEGEEDRALGRHRVLPRDDQAADTDLPGPVICQRRVRHRTESIERRAEQADDLSSRVDAEDRIRVADPLRLGDLGEWRRIGRRQPQVQWPTGRRAALAGSPSQRPHRPAVHPAA
jgi:hypothetical protein